MFRFGGILSKSFQQRCVMESWPGKIPDPVGRRNSNLPPQKRVTLLRCWPTIRRPSSNRILQKSGMNIPDLSELLLNLEMKGRIRQVPGNLFIRVARREE